ncbi:MAG TPA: amidohydrolase family protein, partial [Amphiplicatus sp.]|nr:amidohydrolase family protein [Amphiplicatus sp.]
FAKTDELVALTKAASEFGGGYITHMRSESEDIFDAIDETITIAREANTRAQIYHLKLSGRSNWDKQAELIERLNAARADGVDITADVYTYTAGATGLDASLPPWVQEGGDKAMRDRLKDPAIRKKVIEEMRVDSVGWENLLRQADGPEKVLLVSFRTDALKPLTGKTLAEVAAMRGTSPEDTVIDLMLEDESRVGTIYFLMNEENVRNNIEWPYTMFGSDEEAPAPEGVFLKANPHPRAYGNFARVFAKYVRDEGVISVAEAVRRMTSLSADELGVKERGRLKPGNYADIVIFDPATIQDHATYEKPHQLATGVRDVFVNGVAVLRDEQHTGAMPGRVVRGPGWVGEAEAGGE